MEKHVLAVCHEYELCWSTSVPATIAYNRDEVFEYMAKACLGDVEAHEIDDIFIYDEEFEVHHGTG